MTSKIVGQLNPVEYDGEYFESEPFPIPYFDNKKLKIGFVEANHQPYLSRADDVLQSFLKLTRSDRIGDSQTVYKYYDETLKHAHSKPLKIKSTEDIWDFVHPSEIIILWDGNKDFIYALLVVANGRRNMDFN